MLKMLFTQRAKWNSEVELVQKTDWERLCRDGGLLQGGLSTCGVLWEHKRASMVLTRPYKQYDRFLFGKQHARVINYPKNRKGGRVVFRALNVSPSPSPSASSCKVALIFTGWLFFFFLKQRNCDKHQVFRRLSCISKASCSGRTWRDFSFAYSCEWMHIHKLWHF